MSAAVEARPLVSVIIVSWRVRELLRGCLASLFAELDRLPVASEVIVIDNASGDGTGEMVRDEFPRAVMIDNRDNIGFGRANSQAVPLSRGRYLLLLNPDTLVPEGAIEKMLARMKAVPDIGILGCRLLNGDGSLQRWTGGRFPTLWNTAAHYLFLDKVLGPFGLAQSVYLTADTSDEVEVDWVSGACLLIRRELAPEPLFDPSYFMYGEDMDLCHRVKAAGHRVIYFPAASIVHFQGASMKQQQGDILLSSLKGLRSFYAMTRGRGLLALFDLVTVTGFLIRWLIFASIQLIHPNIRTRARLISSRHHLSIAWRIVGS